LSPAAALPFFASAFGLVSFAADFDAPFSFLSVDFGAFSFF
jgi:hypothetical protein